MQKQPLLIGSTLFTIGLLSTHLSLTRLEATAADNGHLEDILLDTLPTIYTGGLLLWGPLLFILLFCWYLYHHKSKFALSLTALGLLFTVRALFLILTPFGRHPDQYWPQEEGLLHLLTYNGFDFFFSGHTALPYLMALIAWQSLALRLIFLCGSAAMGLGTLLEHTHYSIDVAAAPFMTFCVFVIAQRIQSYVEER